MCIMSTLRKIAGIIGLIGSITFLILSIAFHIPFLWYLDYTALSTEFIGGIWTLCSKGPSLTDWDCGEVTESVAKSLDHDWENYQTIKSMVIIGELCAVAALVLFYISLCFNSTIICILTVVGCGAECVLIMIGSSIAQSTFKEAYGQDAKADWSLYVIWLSWCNSCFNVAAAVAMLVAACLDDATPL